MALLLSALIRFFVFLFLTSNIETLNQLRSIRFSNFFFDDQTNFSISNFEWFLKTCEHIISRRFRAVLKRKLM